jgi:hypothetical protein
MGATLMATSNIFVAGNAFIYKLIATKKINKI